MVYTALLKHIAALNQSDRTVKDRFWQYSYSMDYVDRKYTNFSSTETKTNQESTKLKCVQSYLTVRTYPVLPVHNNFLRTWKVLTKMFLQELFQKY